MVAVAEFAPSRRLACVAAGVGLVALAMTGCAGAESARPTAGTPTVSALASTAAVFSGTRHEREVALADCLTKAGFVVDAAGDGSPGAAFEVDLSGHTDEEYLATMNGCESQVGEPDYEAMPDEQLRASYDSRVAITECLVQNGWSQAQPPAWETFSEQWRAGTKWDPLGEVAAAASTVTLTQQIAATCARPQDDVW